MLKDTSHEHGYRKLRAWPLSLFEQPAPRAFSSLLRLLVQYEAIPFLFLNDWPVFPYNAFLFHQLFMWIA
jgi:hypothetical protein